MSNEVNEITEYQRGYLQAMSDAITVIRSESVSMSTFHKFQQLIIKCLLKSSKE